MISTENVTSSTALTVSDTPSSVTEPLVGDETRELRAASQFEPRHVGQIVTRDDGRNAIDMAGDNMAAEFVADLQRAFQVELWCPRPSVRPWSAERLRRGIDVEPGAAASAPEVDHGQADAVAGDRRAIGDRRWS